MSHFSSLISPRGHDDHQRGGGGGEEEGDDVSSRGGHALKGYRDDILSTKSEHLMEHSSDDAERDDHPSHKPVSPRKGCDEDGPTAGIEHTQMVANDPPLFGKGNGLRGQQHVTEPNLKLQPPHLRSLEYPRIPIPAYPDNNLQARDEREHAKKRLYYGEEGEEEQEGSENSSGIVDEIMFGGRGGVKESVEGEGIVEDRVNGSSHAEIMCKLQEVESELRNFPPSPAVNRWSRDIKRTADDGVTVTMSAMFRLLKKPQNAF